MKSGESTQNVLKALIRSKLEKFVKMLMEMKLNDKMMNRSEPNHQVNHDLP